MGAIYILEGLMIYLYGFDHNPPHIHVKTGGDEFTITLADRIVEGRAKSKHIKMINDFIDTHIDELNELWEKAQRGERITKIIR